MKKILFSILVYSFSNLASCQTNLSSNQTKTEIMNRRFEIAGLDFQIGPNKQVVYRQQMTGGTDYQPDGSVIHWDGYEYVPCKEIDFKTTSLIFMGSYIMFKEFLPMLPADISSLKIIYQSIGYHNDYTIILSPLENAVYSRLANKVITKMDVSGYTYIGQMIFKNESGKLFFLPVGNSSLHKITIPIDEASLQHVFSNSSIGSFYTDKNGLYYLPIFGEQQQLEFSEGKSIQAELHNGYFIYGDKAYPYGNNFGESNGSRTRKDLSLNANELKSILGKYIGDNNQLLTLPYGFTTNIKSTSLANVILQGRPQEPLSKWNWFDFFVVGRDNLKNNTVYYPNKNMNMSGSSHYLIKTPSGFYGVNRNHIEKAIKYDNVMIYNIEKENYESIEIEHFRRLTIHFHIYKNQMYNDYSQPVETELDIQKLKPIYLNGRATEFYTDGTFLVGGYNLGNMITVQKNKQEWLKFEKPLFRDVDWESLQIVSKDVMVDKNNIYQVGSSILEVTPIKHLKLDVKVIPYMNM